jgi:hypothetical protein
VSKTRRNSLHWKKRSENLNPEPVNAKKDTRGLTYEKRHELGLKSHDIASEVRNGFFDYWNLVWGQHMKKWAKRMAAKTWRRLGWKELQSQLKEK